jgi:4-nitrophenyl phosphatase
MEIKDFEALIIDMDGVLWRGHAILPGVKAFFECLRRRSLAFNLATNNSTATPQSVVDRLAQAGVAIKPEEVLTSSLATATYLQGRFPAGTKVHAVGEMALRQALIGAGFELIDEPDDVKAVVIGFDRQISWEKLTRAALAVQNGALFVGTNPDLSFPLEQGQAPGNGAFVRVIELTTGIKPVIIGKPEARLFDLAGERLGVVPDRILAVGDRLETDVIGAQRAGMATALLLTGVTSPEAAAASEIKPGWIFDDLPALTLALEGA